MMKHFFAVAIGGAVGASARYALNILTQSLNQNIFIATLTANIIGCLLMGFMYRWIMLNSEISETLRLFMMVGVLGALTTWSTFSLETIVMLEQGEIIKALGYTLLTLTGCFTAFWIGWKI